MGMHLQNTVFHDRALFIQPYASNDGKFPNENGALAVCAPLGAVFGMHPKIKSWPSHVVNLVVGQAPNQTIATLDPKLNELKLPPYPALPYDSTESSRIEDIRRTVYLANIIPQVTCESLIEIFSHAGEVKCARITEEGPDGLRGCYIEFCDQDSVASALSLNGTNIGGQLVRVSHAMNAIERS